MPVLAPEPIGAIDGLADLEAFANPIRVLVVDDNPTDAEMVAKMLEGGPYSCATVTSYDEGVEVIRQQAHDAYLIDYRLGNRTGLELIKEISASASGPLILLTGLDDPALDGLALAAGASDYLSKNRLTFDDVTRSIRYSVETWRARRTAEVESERFRALYDGVPIGIGRISPEGVFTEANQFLTSLLRYTDGPSLIGRPVLDLVDDRHNLEELLARGAESDQPIPFELRVKRYDGTKLWVGGVVRAQRGILGEVTGFEGAIGDITPRRRVEEQVAMRNAILDQVRSGIIATDLDGRIVFWNNHAEELFGWRAEDALGQAVQDLVVPVDNAARVSDTIWRAVTETGYWSGEYEVLRKDGSTIPTHVANTLISDGKGAPVGIVGISTDISKRVATDQALRESQELFKEMFEGSPVGKTLFEVPSGLMVAVNRAAADFIGIPIDELVGVARVAYTNPADLAAEMALYERLIAGEIANYEIEKHYDLADGTVKWALVKVSLVGALKNGVGLGLAYAIDITARKEAEAEVRFQASLLGQVHNAVIATDLAGAVIYWNRYAEELYGWSAQEVVGRNLLEATVPHDAVGEARAEIGAALFAEGEWEGEVVLFRKDGSRFPAWSSEALLRDQAGRPIGVVGITVDLTQQKESQVEAQRQGDLARSLLEALQDPHALISFDGQVLAVNKAWVRLIVGGEETSRDDGGVGANYVAVCRSSLSPEAFDGSVVTGIDGVLKGAAQRFEHDYSSTGGEAARFFRLVVTPVPGTGAVIALWNVTDEHNTRSALEELIRSKDEFIASVSHELRTPLTAVVGLTHELSEGRVRPDEVPELQSLIAQQAQEVSDIVEDLLVAARASADTITIRPSWFNIRKEVELVVKPWLRGGAHAIDLDAVDRGLTARGDATRVRQILRNLVANAARYGGKPISIDARSDGLTMTIVVRDQGAGIPPAAVERMFEPYARLGGLAGMPSSVGLGLYVSRLLARMMDGDLRYERHDGVTEFCLTLPAERQDIATIMRSDWVDDGLQIQSL